MSRAALAALAMAVGLGACSSARTTKSDGEGGVAAEPPATSAANDSVQPKPKDKEMTPSGAPPADHAVPTIPDEAVADPSLEPVDGADVDPLDPDVFVRVQKISLGESQRGNYRFVLWSDGRFFSSSNGQGAPDPTPPARFSRPLPQNPDKVLDAAAMDEVRAAVRDQGFFGLADGYRRANKRFDGAMTIVEIQLDGNHKRVVAQKVEIPALAAIEDLIWTHAQ